MALAAPFPYFGGKRRIALLVWTRFGNVRNYVEPFFGSGAVLLGRPMPFDGIETINDKCGFVANFWRALQADPDAVAKHAAWPVNEVDLHARHAWLVGRKDSLQARLEGDPDYCDAKVAGWWAWGLSCWIGRGFCSGTGPWHVEEVDGCKQLVRGAGAGRGVNRQLPHLGDAGIGINRQAVADQLAGYLGSLADRLRRVRVSCGDWTRVTGPAVTTVHGPTGVFLDPPYSAAAGRDPDLYRVEDLDVAHAARDWAIEHGDDPRFRICLAGFDGEHAMPDTWECVDEIPGQHPGYGAQARDGYANAGRERLWFSPHCLRPRRQASLFDTPDGADREG